jgi:hypothetical protein
LKRLLIISTLAGVVGAAIVVVGMLFFQLPLPVIMMIGPVGAVLAVIIYRLTEKEGQEGKR